MKLAVLFAAALGLGAQIVSGVHGHSQAAPAGPQAVRSHRQAPYSRGRILRRGGYYPGYPNQVIADEAPTPAKEEKLKELVVSPVYQKDKISPKLIEIP